MTIPRGKDGAERSEILTLLLLPRASTLGLYRNSHAGRSLQQESQRIADTPFEMARGNQRDKAREANQKKMADQVCALRRES